MSPADREPAGLRRRLATMFGALLALRALREALRRRSALAPPPESDEDPRRREVPHNRWAETLVALLLALAGLFGLGFTAAYAAAGTNPQLLGIAIGGALALLAGACIVAGELVVPQETSVEERDVLLDEAEAEEVAGLIGEGGEGISRRRLLSGAAGLAGAGVITAVVTPLASLGPDLDAVHRTPWARGVRLAPASFTRS